MCFGVNLIGNGLLAFAVCAWARTAAPTGSRGADEQGCSARGGSAQTADPVGFEQDFHETSVGQSFTGLSSYARKSHSDDLKAPMNGVSDGPAPARARRVFAVVA